LKLEDKIIRICNTGENKEKKLTIAMARVLATVASKIGGNMYKKKNCTAILDRLVSELTVDELDDERRVSEVLVNFSEVIAQAPEAEMTSINEQVISDFHA
jgi:CRISPR/Cas system CSM-associated protein Csm2 small subunit